MKDRPLAPLLFALGLALALACTTVQQPEDSVKPGINESFLDPELDVDDFVDRFEVESREVFSQRHKIMESLGLQPGQSVADIGAGTGLFLDLIAETVGSQGRLYAVDIAPRFIAHLEARVEERGFSWVEPRLCSERSAELPLRSVDVAFICDTYHHFEYPKSTMRSIHGALRDGGDLVIIDFERIPGVSREWLMNHVRAGKEEVIAEITSFGFERIEEVEVPGLDENYFLRFRKR